MKSILIVSDSRGTLLKPLMIRPPGYTIDFEAKGGATLQDAKDIVRRKMKSSRYTCVYIMAGICSVTSKEGGVISLPFDTKAEIVKTVTREILTTLTELDTNSNVHIPRD